MFLCACFDGKDSRKYLRADYNLASIERQSNTGILSQMRLKADLLLFMVAIIWGTAFVAQGIAGQYHVAYLFNGVSFMLAAVILVSFIPKETRSSKVTNDQWKWMLIAGSLLFSATAMQQVGLLYTKVANASFLTSLYAVFTPFLLWISFREKPHGLDLIAVALAGVGAFLLSTAGKFVAHPGDIIEVTGSIFWALHFVVLGKFASKFESISFAAGHFFICGFLNFVIGLFLEDISILAALPLLGAILYRATLSIGIGYTLQVWGQKHTPPTDAALILGLEAVFAVFAAWIMLGQSLVLIQVIGCVIIFIGVLISQLKQWNSAAAEHDHLVQGR
jgi:drug/metabolite transporter (DMT)-like permease